MQAFDTDRFRVKPGRTVDLDEAPTRVDALYASRKDYNEEMDEASEALGHLQRRLYAEDRQALLLIFQGMDTAGKDGAIRRVMSGIDPTGCQVYAFKQPSHEELDHDWLWRTTCRLPERGRIGIFNRSYYEEVLIVRVRPDVLAGQRLPEARLRGAGIWTERFDDIRNLESYLHRNGTQILKFFLHISKDEQRSRFLSRIDDPEKNWKFAPADIAERQRWDDYQRAYADALSATSTKAAPWYVVPSDDKMNARMIIARVLLDTLNAMGPQIPEAGASQRALLDDARARLLAEQP